MTAISPGIGALRAGLAAIVTVALLGACTRTLVYGERSGFNVGIAVDAAKALPINVNAGLERRVVGLVPPSGEPRDDQVVGEGVNMFSRFDISYDADDSSVFGGTHRINTAFASGAAALAISESNNAAKIVAAIVQPVDITLDNSPEAQRVRRALSAYILENEAQRETYLMLAENAGIELDQDLDPPLRARVAISDPKNHEINKKIADDLQLL